MNGFRRLGELARALADRHCDGRLALIQEGGYGRSDPRCVCTPRSRACSRRARCSMIRWAFCLIDETRGDAGIAAARGSMRRYWSI